MDESAASWRLWGWISPPQACRHQADVQYFYVNGRMLKDRLLGHAIRQAYGDQLADERSPTFVLYLELPANEVDVNVHPAKHEVRFQQARQIHDFIMQALRPLLSPAIPSTELASTPEPTTGSIAGLSRGSPPQHQYRPAAADIAAQLQALQPASRTPLPAVMEAPPATGVNIDSVTAAMRRTIDTEPATSWRVLTVLHQRVALIQRIQSERAEPPLQLLDLQRVQQRALAEQYAQQFTTGLAGQPLLIPVQLNHAEAIKQAKQVSPALLARLGILLEWQRQQCIVKQVPSALRQTNINETLPALLTQLVQWSTDHDQLPQSLWLWLAQLQVASTFSATQAEHWLQQWLSWQQPEQMIQSLPLPPLPEPLK